MILSYHVKLLVGGGKMNRCSSAIVLGDKIRIGLHDFSELFRVTQTDCAVKSNGRIFGNWGIPAV